MNAAWQHEHVSSRAFQAHLGFMQSVSSASGLPGWSEEFLLWSVLYGPVTRSWHLPFKTQRDYAVLILLPLNSAKPVWSQSEVWYCRSILPYVPLNVSPCLKWRCTQSQAVSPSYLFQTWHLQHLYYFPFHTHTLSSKEHRPETTLNRRKERLVLYCTSNTGCWAFLAGCSVSCRYSTYKA